MPFQRLPLLTMLLRMVSNFRILALKASFPELPTASSRSQKLRITGLCWLATSAH